MFQHVLEMSIQKFFSLSLRTQNCRAVEYLGFLRFHLNADVRLYSFSILGERRVRISKIHRSQQIFVVIIEFTESLNI